MLARILKLVTSRQDLVVVGLLLIAIVLMVLPISPILIDIFIAINLSSAILILVVGLLLRRPDEFSTFPAVVLISTIFRLAIAVATTRMILSKGEAGHIVSTFGNFVTSGSIGIGLVTFLIIAIVQFIVVTKGAERIAEVAARFTLDALPGRQLSIDAEARAGDITAEEAKRRRRSLDKENQFFGAMDGAMKFVKGDAIAGIIIILVNLAGGIAVGMLSKGMSFSDSAALFTKLTIGDGLVQQIPALLMALCAGTVVTRVTTEDSADLSTDMGRQIVANPQTLIIVAVASFFAGIVPGFPTTVFWLIAATLAAGAFLLSRRQKAAAVAEAAALATSIVEAETGKTIVPFAAAKKGDQVVVRLGAGVLAEIKSSEFVEARTRMLASFVSEFGFSPPIFSYMAGPDLPPDGYSVDLEGVSLKRGQIPAKMVLVKIAPDVTTLLAGKTLQSRTEWPDLGATWVNATDGAALKASGTVLNTPAQALVMSIELVLRQNAHLLLGFDTVQTMFSQLRKENQSLAEQTAQAVTAMRLLDILRRLVAEGVPLAPRNKLFEALLAWPGKDFEPVLVCEHVRKMMRRHICAKLADENKTVSTYLLEPALEAAIKESVVNDNSLGRLQLGPAVATALVNQLTNILQAVHNSGKKPVVIIANELRRHVSDFVESQGIKLSVLAHQELAPEFSFQPVGTISAAGEIY